MTRTIEREYKANATNAIKKFFTKHTELSYWKEQFEWMNETNTEHFTDDKMGDGSRNNDWSYSLWLYKIDEHTTYIAVIERE